SWLAYRLSLQQTLRNMMEGVITRTRHRMDADLMGMGITITILLGLWPGPVLQQPIFQFSIMMVPVRLPSQLMAAHL
ncbi:hypothetical protein SBT33_26375, partial [Klebsiella pneumoniae]|uniref:hypothetical protein n=1 Tax=Klebsiella pneumoniae TaxID=573 RepID=UPI00298BFAE8